MKKRFSLVVGCVILCLAVGCGKRSQDGGGAAVRIVWRSDGQPLNVDSLFLPAHYVLLDHTTPEALIGAPSRIVAEGGRLYIFDLTLQNSVYVFDRSGRFLHRVGRKGGGAGEYNRLINFTVHGKQVYLVDNTLSRLIHYDSCGRYVENWNLPVSVEAVEWLDNGGWLLTARKESGKSGPGLLVTDSVLQIRDTILQFRSDDTENFLCTEMFQQTDRGLLFNRPVNDTLYLLDRTDGRILEKIFCDFGPKRLPDRYRSDMMETAEALMKGDLNSYVYWSGTPLFLKDYLVGRARNGLKEDSFTWDLEMSEIHTYRLDGKSYVSVVPVFARALSEHREIVSLIDPYCLPRDPAADVQLPDSVKKHVREGGTVIALHKLRTRAAD